MINPGRGFLQGPVLGMQGRRLCQRFDCSMRIESVVHPYPEAATFRENLAVSFPAASTGAVDQLFWTTGLRAEIGRPGQGAVTTHPAVEHESFNNPFHRAQYFGSVCSLGTEQAESTKQPAGKSLLGKEQVVTQLMHLCCSGSGSRLQRCHARYGRAALL